MPSNEEKPQSDFKVSFKTDEPFSLLMQQVIELRAEVGALSIIVLDGLVIAGKDPLTISERYETARKNLLLELLFQLQDKPSETPAEPS